MDRIRLAAEAGAADFGGPGKEGRAVVPSEHVARLDYAMLISLGLTPSISEAAARWGVSFGIARRLIDDVKAAGLTVQIEAR